MSFDDLIAYLDTRFRQFAALQEQTSQQVATLQEHTTQRFAALEEHTTQRFENLQEQIVGLREENNRRFEKLEEGLRHTQLTVEHLDDKIRLVAEGVSNVNEKVDAFRAELQGEIELLKDVLMKSRRVG